MSWKQEMADYFNFTRRDRIAVIILVLLIAGIFFLPGVLSPSAQGNKTPDSSWITALRKMEQKEADIKEPYNRAGEENSTAYQYDRSVNNYHRQSKGELFYFDPNTLSAEGWHKLGLRDKTIGIIQNYLSKGGQFKKPGDLQRIYGLFPDEFERIAPYIKIESDATDYKNSTGYNPAENQPVKTHVPRYTVVDINSADTTSLIALPGIGSKLAQRIITFRDKLGGFYSINQVSETFGLADSTFQKIKQYLKLENDNIKKININTATVDELKTHPYVRYALANSIIAYRNEHGIFSSVNDLRKIMAVTDDMLNKASPYLTVEK